MRLMLRLHGPFQAFWADRTPCGIAGAKQQALLALLATAPEYARTRGWLIARLWSNSDEERGRRNLRQMLHGLRTALGVRYREVLGVEADLVYLRSDYVSIVGVPTDGEFLEGFDLCEEGFEDWLRDQRQSSAQLPHDRRAQSAPGAALPGSAAVPCDPPASASGHRALHRIAVMPFQVSDSSVPPGAGDAMAHRLSVAFARSGLVDSISHHSCRRIAADGIARQTSGADYHLIGRCGSELGGMSVDVTLVASHEGRVLWGERFDVRGWTDPATNEEMVQTIAGQCLWLIVAQSCHLSSVQPISSATAQILMMTGVAEMHSFHSARFRKSLVMLNEVANRCPGNPLPWAWQAQWHLLQVFQGWSDDPAGTRRLADDAIARALDLNPYCELSLAIDGNLRNVLDGDFATAASRFEAARTINPSSAMICQLSAVLHCFTGEGERAVAMTERTRRLAPRDPRRAFFAGIGASAYLVAERWNEAISEAEAAMILNPGHLSAERCRVIALHKAGRSAEAATAASELVAKYPNMTVSNYLRTHPARETPTGQSWACALREAGVPMN